MTAGNTSNTGSTGGAGYSGTPLVKKLGIKPGFRVLILHAPDDYEALIGGWPENVAVSTALEAQSEAVFDFIHTFFTERAALEGDFLALKQALKKDGLWWVSWPKKTAKVKLQTDTSRITTDITENIVREIALNKGLVDVKVAAIDAVWSGLKLVYRVKDR